MSDLINQYPYTDFHSVNLDYILKVVRENAGLHLEVSGNQLLMKTADNTIVSAITIPYATEAGSANTAVSAGYASTAGSAASATYAASAGSAATATNATNANHASTADSATSATSATTATNADHADTADLATNATNAVNAQNAEYATNTGNCEKAGNGVKAAEVTTSGQLWIDLEGGGTVACDIKRAKSAQKDSLGNDINTTYIASIVNDNGVLKFKNANGSIIASVTPSSQSATEDDYGNLIASYIKAIAAGSNYLTVTHGDGTTETLTIKYSEAAWKDTNGNVIKNFYAGSMECVEDDQTGHYNLVVYNGDTPRAELYRFEIEAYSAQVAAEATHAASADYATSAGSAATAATSTGSVSSIARNRNVLTITNGDGTTSTIDITKASQKYLYMKDTVNNNTNLFDAAFTVGHEEEFGITNYNNPWGDSTAWDSIYEGVWIYYSDSNNWIMFESPVEVGFNNNGGADNNPYILKIFDGNAGVLKVFEISEPADISLTPGNVTVKRVL